MTMTKLIVHNRIMRRSEKEKDIVHENNKFHIWLKIRGFLAHFKFISSPSLVYLVGYAMR